MNNRNLGGNAWKGTREYRRLVREYESRFEQYSPKNHGGSEAAARRAGWMTQDEFIKKKRAGKPLYSKSELDGAAADAFNRANRRSSVRQHVKKEAVTPPRGAGAAAAAPQKQPELTKPAGKKKPRRLNWEPSDQKEAEDPPPQNQQEPCVIA